MSRSIACLAACCVLLVAVAGCPRRVGGPSQLSPGPTPVGPQGTTGRVAAPVPAPDVSAMQFAAVDLSGSPESYKSSWGARSKAVAVSRGAGGGVECRVTGSAKEGNQYGGVKFAVTGARALRLDLSLINPSAISVVYVDGYDAKKNRVMRWLWRLDARRPAPASSATYVLVPGKPMGYFAAAQGTEADAGKVKQVDVFVAGKPSSEFGLTLHKAEYAK